MKLLEPYINKSETANKNYTTTKRSNNNNNNNKIPNNVIKEINSLIPNNADPRTKATFRNLKNKTISRGQLKNSLNSTNNNKLSKNNKNKIIKLLEPYINKNKSNIANKNYTTT